MRLVAFPLALVLRKFTQVNEINIFLIWLRYKYISMCNISIHSQHFPFFFFLFFEFLSLGSGVVSLRPGAFKDAPVAELFDP